jgi:hypothetical protein
LGAATGACRSWRGKGPQVGRFPCVLAAVTPRPTPPHVPTTESGALGSAGASGVPPVGVNWARWSAVVVVASDGMGPGGDLARLQHPRELTGRSLTLFHRAHRHHGASPALHSACSAPERAKRRVRGWWGVPPKVDPRTPSCTKRSESEVRWTLWSTPKTNKPSPEPAGAAVVEISMGRGGLPGIGARTL